VQRSHGRIVSRMPRIDPIEHAWRRCNPHAPLPSKLEARAAPSGLALRLYWSHAKLVAEWSGTTKDARRGRFTLTTLPRISRPVGDPVQSLTAPTDRAASATIAAHKGSEALLQGHTFDFETGICTRCGMSEIEFEKLGEPQCTGKKPEIPAVVDNP